MPTCKTTKVTMSQSIRVNDVTTWTRICHATTRRSVHGVRARRSVHGVRARRSLHDVTTRRSLHGVTSWTRLHRVTTERRLHKNGTRLAGVVSVPGLGSSCRIILNWYSEMRGARGSVVIKRLCYKPGGRGFETHWGECSFSIYLTLPAALDPEVHSASNRNECQKQKNNVSGEQKAAGV
jgi:hypothetical protein